jgi:glycosyltransferase involved in cell wall biosynthesis
MTDTGVREPAPVRAAVVGVSEGSTCGVHDHGVLLVEGLRRRNVSCTLHWLWRTAQSMRGARSEIRAWTRELAADLDRDAPDAIVLQYSVFAYSYRGIPLFVRPILSALRGSGIPMVAVLHELAYPWRLGGVRGKAWALTQRALLVEVVRDSAAIVVTAPFRADWLDSRAWLPRRTLAFAPVYSNLPAPIADPARARSSFVVGLFGYAYEGAASSLVLDAVRALQERGLQVELCLLGAPGPSSPAAEGWRSAARRHGVEQAISFSGVLSAGALSNALAACDVLLHAEPTGPTSRKGTLAASLASGTAVVALDGPLRWSELVDAQAARVVQPTASALVDALADLLEDRSGRQALGARGRAFAASAMSVERTAQVLAGLLGDAIASHER